MRWGTCPTRMLEYRAVEEALTGDECTEMPQKKERKPMKQKIEIEVDIPDGYEFVRIGYAEAGEQYVFIGCSNIWTVTGFGRKNELVVIIRKSWTPPSWMKKGTWIARDRNGDWWLHDKEPCMSNQGYNSDGHICELNTWMFNEPFPPSCDNWEDSKREIV